MEGGAADDNPVCDASAVSEEIRDIVEADSYW